MEIAKPASKQELLQSTTRLLSAVRTVAEQEGKLAPQETKTLKSISKNQLLYLSGSVLRLGDLVSTALKSKK